MIKRNSDQNKSNLSSENNLYEFPNLTKNSFNDENKVIIGKFEEAPKFLQDNEFIKKGYILNCTSFKKALKCLFICHNETMNTWSHLLGAIFFIFLI